MKQSNTPDPKPVSDGCPNGFGSPAGLPPEPTARRRRRASAPPERGLAFVLAAGLFAALSGCAEGGDGALRAPASAGPALDAQPLLSVSHVGSGAKTWDLAADVLVVEGGTSDGASPDAFLVSRLGRVPDDVPPASRLEIPNGRARSRFDGEFLVWLDAAVTSAEDRRYRIFDLEEIGETDARVETWWPDAAESLTPSCEALTGGWLGYVMLREDDASRRSRVGLVSLADPGAGAVELGEFDVSSVGCGSGDDVFVWWDDRALYLAEAPFETATPRPLVDLDSGIHSLRVEGRLVSWSDRTGLWLLDLDRPLEEHVNPRFLGDYRRLSQTARHVVFQQRDGEAAWVVDGRLPGDSPRSVYAADEPEERKPALYGPRVVFASCRKVSRVTFPVPARRDCADGRDDPPGPRFSLSFAALDPPDPFGRLRSMPLAQDLSSIGTISGTTSGLAYTVTEEGGKMLYFWNPAAPRRLGVNPLPLLEAKSDGVQARLVDQGLVVSITPRGGAQRFRFLPIIELLMASGGDS